MNRRLSIGHHFESTFVLRHEMLCSVNKAKPFTPQIELMINESMTGLLPTNDALLCLSNHKLRLVDWSMEIIQTCMQLPMKTEHTKQSKRQVDRQFWRGICWRVDATEACSSLIHLCARRSHNCPLYYTVTNSSQSQDGPREGPTLRVISIIQPLLLPIPTPTPMT